MGKGIQGVVTGAGSGIDRVDVSDGAQVQRIVDVAIRAYGRIDILKDQVGGVRNPMRIAILVLVAVAAAFAQDRDLTFPTPAIPLWEKGAPGALGNEDRDQPPHSPSTRRFAKRSARP